MASGSENTRQHMERTNRDASLAHAIVHAAESYIAQDLDAIAEKLDVQTDIVGQLGASFHALAARVARLEERAEGVGSAAGSTGKRPVCEANEPRLPCAPLDSLVERMANAYRTTPGTTVNEWMAAALRVAAEGLLGDVTDEERAALGFGNVATTNRFAAALRRRLAAVLEACR